MTKTPIMAKGDIVNTLEGFYVVVREWAGTYPCWKHAEKYTTKYAWTFLRCVLSRPRARLSYWNVDKTNSIGIDAKALEVKGRWRKSETAGLRQMLETRHRVDDIGIALERSMESVRNKARAEGLEQYLL